MNLRVEALTVHRGGRAVISGLTLPAFPPGELAVIAGPNAAGKSTLLRAMAGLLPATGGLALGGQSLLRLSPAARAGILGFMPQSPETRATLSVHDSLLVALKAGGGPGLAGASAGERVVRILDRFGLRPLALRPLAALSGGQRQAVALAQAMVRDPRVLLLDEPTAALDPGRQFDLLSAMRDLAREGRIVIAVLHDLAQAAQWADRIVLLQEGALIASGPPQEVLKPGILSDVYGIEARVERCSQGRTMVIVDGRKGSNPHANP